jgi:hypothetical protein
MKKTTEFIRAYTKADLATRNTMAEERLYKAVDFVTVPRELLIITETIQEAFMLATVINLAKVNKARGKMEDGWFRCSKAATLPWVQGGERTERRLMGKLAKQALIFVKMKGNPAKRWVKVNISSIYRKAEKGLDAYLGEAFPKKKRASKKGQNL